VDALVKGGADAKVSSFLLAYQFEVLVERDKSSFRDKPSQMIKDARERIAIMNEILQGYWTLKEASLYNKTIQHIISHKDKYPVLELVGGLAPFLGTPEEAKTYGTAALANHIQDNLRQELDRGLRSPDDWSIKTPLGCNCEWCKTATNFLQDSTEIKCVWPVVQAGRDHVHTRFSMLELPVSLSVEKKGSPHRLIMVKTDRLYQNAKVRFARVEEAYRKFDALNRNI
jgi:hypothetical protein